jgi:hypothetical protein
MRYLIITYYRKASGQIDESTAVARNLKMRDHQTASVILDFKKLAVVKAQLGGDSVPKDFNRIVEYYMQHYENIIKRLFEENGYEIELKKSGPELSSSPDQLVIDHKEPAPFQ